MLRRMANVDFDVTMQKDEQQSFVSYLGHGVREAHQLGPRIGSLTYPRYLSNSISDSYVKDLFHMFTVAEPTC